MSTWVIIPVKPLARAKSRLASVLTQEQRAQLAELLMRHAIRVVQPVKSVAGVLVISRDPKALSIARDLGAHTVQESGTPELNNALMRATQVVRGFRGDAVLILPADLPLISPEDVTSMIEMGREENSIVIATDAREDGTNAMLTRPPGLIPYSYGIGSYERHMMSAREVGAVVRHYHSERLMLDIDVPDDLERYYQIAGAHGAIPQFLQMNGTSIDR